MAQLQDVEGIGEKYSADLKMAGVRSIMALLEKGATLKGRKEIAEKSGVSEDLVLQWVNHADLYRIRGIGSEYSDLLEAAGVDTVPELAQRNADSLMEKLKVANTEKKRVRRLPVLAQVQDWIAQAKSLPRVINY
jgi:predicted flap endonuclease-1-like 5' DNA nuclease